MRSSRRWLYRVFLILLGALLIVWFRNGNFNRRSLPEPTSWGNLQRNADLIIGSKVFKVEVADTDASRAKGLSGRPSLPKGSGLLFRFEHPAVYTFWMQGMRFPLDFVWIRNGRVVEITPSVPHLPAVGGAVRTVQSSESVDAVLEVAAGQARDIHIGDAAALDMR